VIDTFEILMPCFHRQDVLFAETLESKVSPNTSNKRADTEALLQASDVEEIGRRNKRKLDNLPPCFIATSPDIRLILVGKSIRIRRGLKLSHKMDHSRPRPTTQMTQ